MTIAEKAGGGHKIESVVRGAETHSFAYDGAEVVDDGRFLYSFDMKGRLVSATEKVSVPPVRRILYTYSGPGRLVGRRAEYATVFPAGASDWKVEDRPQILAADGLPADTTFIWDAITDRIVTVAHAGATAAASHGGLLKQVIHGGAGYDDPIETTTLDRLSATTVNYLYPVYDEAGAGQLEIVLNRDGEIVARSVTNDPYGADPLDLTGAAVDRVTIRAKKTQAGAIAEVEVSIGLTETVAASSIVAGVRLTALDGAGTPLRTTAATPSVDPSDGTSIRWTLTAPQWSALTAGSANLSIAVTNALRASAWGTGVPVMPAPEWAISALGVRNAAASPIEIRESTASLSTWLAGIGPDAEETRKLYEIEALPLLAMSESGTATEDILASRMQAHPFAEPVTGLDYVRARWYRPGSGTWLSPDPEHYRDSSNVYVFGAGDPVGERDPSGKAAYLVFRHFDNRGAATYPIAGHFFLAFDEKGLEDVDRWRELVRYGRRNRALPTAQAEETFSFHPDNLPGEKRAGLVYTTAARIGYNEAVDVLAFRSATNGDRVWNAETYVWRLDMDQDQQESAYDEAVRQRDLYGAGLYVSGTYSVLLNNCGTWAKQMIEEKGRSGLPLTAYLPNGYGVGVGGPGSLIFGPQLLASVALSAAYVGVVRPVAEFGCEYAVATRHSTTRAVRVAGSTAVRSGRLLAREVQAAGCQAVAAMGAAEAALTRRVEQLMYEAERAVRQRMGLP